MADTETLFHRNIVLCVTGGIAAYKACALCRLLVKHGAQVRVAMTAAAVKFVGPQTFAALSGHPVYTDLAADAAHISHVALAAEADLIVTAPATANTLAKIAAGMADNIVTGCLLCATCPIVLVPAMNAHMYLHPATRSNLKLLSSRGCFIMPSPSGDLACGDTGPGRMPEPEEIYAYILKVLGRTNPAPRLGLDANTLLPPPPTPLELGQTKLLPQAAGAGLRILITAGPTVEALDPVRVLTNRSSGKMGYALARAARARGAEVTLVSGPVSLPAPDGVRRLDVRSAVQMLQAVEQEVAQTDIVIGCAAVADYRPERPADTKVASADAGDALTVRLVKNPDIIAAVGHREQRRPYTVGFAAQTDDDRNRARAKLTAKKLDLIVLNHVAAPDVGFYSDDNEVFVFDRDGELAHFPQSSKRIIAEGLIDLILAQAQPYLKQRA